MPIRRSAVILSVFSLRVSHIRGIFVATTAYPIAPPLSHCLHLHTIPYSHLPTPMLPLNILGSFLVIAPGFTAALLTHVLLGVMQVLEKVLQHVMLCNLPSSEDRQGWYAHTPAEQARLRLLRVVPNEWPSISASAQLTFSFEESLRAQCCWQLAVWKGAVPHGVSHQPYTMRNWVMPHQTLHPYHVYHMCITHLAHRSPAVNIMEV